ncbi:MAG: hypothetical protein QOH25_2896 [Acidobacteriota bacterium]|jgi:hypothetical protein|nr:hypothetical protein [Acidobacteriota bacterium]
MNAQHKLPVCAVPLKARIHILLVGLLAFSSIAFSQTPDGKAAPQKVTKAEKGARPSRERADPMIEQRRNTAISLLTTLADEAKSYHDQVLRARVLARAADALWSGDAERARTLFQRAWEAAVVADEESAHRLEEEIRKQQQASGAAAVTAPPNIRNEVLRLAARRDRALGEAFLKKIEEAKEREAANDSQNRDPWMASASQSQRLRLAMQLVQDNDTERALQYADPALTSVSQDSIYFLSALREKNPAAADQRYAALLARAEADPASDANTVSGLSSYAFTPFLYIVFHARGGASQMQQRGATPAPDLPADLRKAFLNTAAQILLRPIPPPEQDTTTAGRAGRYLVIKRLLPLFEQYAPERGADLRVLMTALMTDVPERARTGENRAVTRGIVPEDNSRDPMQAMQERLSQATNSAERDAIYVDMAASLAGSGDPRARDLVEKIEDTELRQQTRAHVDFEYLDNALQKKDTPEAIRIARTGELTNFQRVWGLTQVARLLIKSDRERAVDLLEEALAVARRIGGSDAERPRALTAISAVFIEADRSRVWELMAEVVKAGNSAEGFTGDDARITSMLRFKNGAIMRSSNAADFDLLGVFRTLARNDLYPAIEAAKNFTGEVPRANAILAIARTVLEEKQK